jgi:hypothetical protein
MSDDLVSPYDVNDRVVIARARTILFGEEAEPVEEEPEAEYEYEESEAEDGEE